METDMTEFESYVMEFIKSKGYKDIKGCKALAEELHWVVQNSILWWCDENDIVWYDPSP